MPRAVVDAETVPESVVFSTFKGLKNTVTSERLETTDLERALNVDLDDVGQLHRRRGYVLKSAGNCHSIYTNGGTTYGVKDGVLGVINPNYSFTALLSGVGADRVAYVSIGDATYFASRAVSGRINADNTVSPWGAASDAGLWLSPVINPTSTLGAVAGRLLGAPPLATALAYLNGRIYLANGRTLWATELYMYDYVDKTKSYKMFEDEITGIGAVTDGLYVGTESGVWYLSGTLNEMKRTRMADYGVMPGSMVETPADFIGLEKAQSKTAIMMMTTGGVYAGLDNGGFYSITEDRVWLPQAVNVSALFRKQDGVNQYLAVANSGGTPVSNTRIGDYVDAEIIRFQGA